MYIYIYMWLCVCVSWFARVRVGPAFTTFSQQTAAVRRKCSRSISGGSCSARVALVTAVVSAGMWMLALVRSQDTAIIILMTIMFVAAD